MRLAPWTCCLLLGFVAAGCQFVSGLADLETEEPPVTAECEVGEQRDCYDGPSALVGVGVCAKGTQECTGSPSAWGPCEGQVLPAEDEICGDTHDDNCDGRVECAGDVVWAVALGTTGADAEIPLERAHALPTSGGLAWAAGSVYAAMTFAPEIDTADASFVALSDVDGSTTTTISPGTEVGDEIGDDVTVVDGEPVFGGFAQAGSVQFQGVDAIEFEGLGAFFARPQRLSETSWSRQLGGSGAANTVATVKLDSCEDDGSIAVVGQYRGSPSDLPLTSEYAAFVALYDAATGAPRWMQAIALPEGNGASKATQVSCQGGRIVVGGVFKGPTYLPDRPDHLDAWLVSLDLEGLENWPAAVFGLPLKAEPTDPDDTDPLHHENRIWDLWIDDQQDIYVIGTFATELQVGDVTLSAGANFADVWIAKLSRSDGSTEWARSFGGEGAQLGLAIAGVEGGLVIGGSVSGPMTVDEIEITDPSSAPNLAGSGYLLELDRDGQCRVDDGCWATTFASRSLVFRLDSDDSGYVYAFGGFEDTVDFGSLALTAAGGGDHFVAKVVR